MSPEFIGIRILYLESKAEIIGIGLWIALLTVMVMAINLVNYHNISMKEKSTCPAEAIATIQEDGKLICVMQRIGPATKTRREGSK